MTNEEENRMLMLKLGSIEKMLEVHARDLAHLESRLLGEDDNGDGILGKYDQRLKKLETWFIRVTTAIVVWTFMTGNGPVSLASVIHLLNPGAK